MTAGLASIPTTRLPFATPPHTPVYLLLCATGLEGARKSFWTDGVVSRATAQPTGSLLETTRATFATLTQTGGPGPPWQMVPRAQRIIQSALKVLRVRGASASPCHFPGLVRRMPIASPKMTATSATEPSGAFSAHACSPRTQLWSVPLQTIPHVWRPAAFRNPGNALPLRRRTEPLATTKTPAPWATSASAASATRVPPYPTGGSLPSVLRRLRCAPWCR